MYWKIGLVVVAFISGWIINGWRLQLKISELEKQYAQELVIAHQKTREAEQLLINETEKIERQKNVEISNINSRLSNALNELRLRQTRESASKDSTDCKGTTGANLSREDAEFLTREAARADRLRQALGSCYIQYDTIQKRSPQ